MADELNISRVFPNYFLLLREAFIITAKHNVRRKKGRTCLSKINEQHLSKVSCTESCGERLPWKWQPAGGNKAPGKVCLNVVWRLGEPPSFLFCRAPAPALCAVSYLIMPRVSPRLLPPHSSVSHSSVLSFVSEREYSTWVVDVTCKKT